MDFIEKLRDHIERNNLFNRGDRVLVALSGGADSVSLLVGLCELWGGSGEGMPLFDVYAYHLNHMLRGDAADEDQRFVEELCGRLGVELFCEKKDVSKMAEDAGLSFEDMGRRLRYEGLARAVGAIKDDARLDGEKSGLGRKALADGVCSACAHGPRVLVATGHHAGDVAETFLMNVLRGSGLSGLCSIAMRTERLVKLDGGRVRLQLVRPLLPFFKSELEGYLRERGESWREDATNEDTRYFRNRIRSLLGEPEIRQICSCVELVAQDSEYLEQRAAELSDALVVGLGTAGAGAAVCGGDGVGAAVCDGEGVAGVLLKKEADALHRSELSRLVRICVRRVVGDMVDLSRRDVEAVMGLGRTGAEIIVGIGERRVLVHRGYDGLEFSLFSAAEGGANTGGLGRRRPFGAAEVRGPRAFCESENKGDVLLKEDKASGAGLLEEGKASGSELLEEGWERLSDERENHYLNSVFIKRLSDKELESFDFEEFMRLPQSEAGECIVIDLNKTLGELRLRSRREGDRIKPFGMSGSRSVKKLLIDEKVDRRVRESVPLVVDDEKILWVAGVRMSETVRVEGFGAKTAGRSCGNEGAGAAGARVAILRYVHQ